jgi:membrane dipeptidase
VSSLDAARALLAQHPLVDGHNDLPFEMREKFGYDLTAYDVGQRQDKTHTDLVRLTEGGVGAQFWSVFVPAGWAGEQAITATFEQVDFVHRMVARYPDRLKLATNTQAVSIHI